MRRRTLVGIDEMVRRIDGALIGAGSPNLTVIYETPISGLGQRTDFRVVEYTRFGGLVGAAAPPRIIVVE